MATDATGLKVLIPKLPVTHDGYLEVYRREAWRIFQYEPTRAPRRRRRSWRPSRVCWPPTPSTGTTQSSRAALLEAGCNAHGRRKLRDAEDAQPRLGHRGRRLHHRDLPSPRPRRSGAGLHGEALRAWRQRKVPPLRAKLLRWMNAVEPTLTVTGGRNEIRNQRRHHREPVIHRGRIGGSSVGRRKLQVAQAGVEGAVGPQSSTRMTERIDDGLSVPPGPDFCLAEDRRSFWPSSAATAAQSSSSIDAVIEGMRTAVAGAVRRAGGGRRERLDGQHRGSDEGRDDHRDAERERRMARLQSGAVADQGSEKLTSVAWVVGESEEPDAAGQDDGATVATLRRGLHTLED